MTELMTTERRDISIKTLPGTRESHRCIAGSGSLLLVNTSPAWFEQVSDKLDFNGSVIHAAESVESALELARHVAPSLIIIDMATPGEDAAAVCRRLKSDPATDEIPVLILTALGDDESSVLRTLEAGADDYLEISVSKQLLRKKVESLIAQSTDRRARKEAEAMYHGLIESLADTVYVGEPVPPYSPIYISHQMESIGYSLEEWHRSPDLWVSILHPEDREWVLGETDEARIAGRDHEYEYRVIARDGSIHWLHDRRRLILDEMARPVCWQAVIIDITERKRAEKELRESETRYRAFVEQSSEGIWCFELEQPLKIDRLVDEQVEHFYRYGYLVECNAVMSERYGFSCAEDFLGVRLAHLLPPSDPRNVEYLRAFIRSCYRLTDAESLEVDVFGKTRHFLNTLVGVVENGFLVRAWGSQRDITERKRAEEALRESEEALRFIQFSMDHAADAAFWIGSDARLLYVNEAACRSLGYSREELLAMTIHDIDVYAKPEIWPEYWRITIQGVPLSFESQHRTKEGRIFPVEIKSTYLEFNGKEYACAFARDITERKRMEQALKRSEHEYRNLFESANDPIIIFEPESEAILEVNDKACEVYGFTHDEFIGMSLNSLTQNVERGEDLIGELVKSGCDKNFETVHFRKDGTPIEMMASTSLIEYGGRKAIMGITRDITEIKRLQQQLIQSEKLAALGQLLSGVAHELNNPLTSVIGYTQLILTSPKLDRQSRQRLEIVNQEAERTRRIVQNLLSFSRQHKPARAEVDLNELISQTLELRAYEMKVNNIYIKRELGKIPLLLADGHQMQQVFLNIIINAEQAMQSAHRGGTLTVKSELSRMDETEIVRVVIADDGPGIAPENLSKLFDPFFTTKPVGKGTGLGLSISYGIVKEHGGSIRVESRQGSGTSFIIELPAQSH